MKEMRKGLFFQIYQDNENNIILNRKNIGKSICLFYKNENAQSIKIQDNKFVIENLNKATVFISLGILTLSLTKFNIDQDKRCFSVQKCSHTPLKNNPSDSDISKLVDFLDVCQFTRNSISPEYHIEDEDLNKILPSNRRLKKLESESTQCPTFCPICYSEFIKTLNGIINGCDHRFCLNCISEWANLSTKCPLCKVDFNSFKGKDDKGDPIIRFFESKEPTYSYQEDSNDRIVANADDQCYVCKEEINQNLLLICDHCLKKTCHIYCLNPPLQFIPENNWFCDYCVIEEGVETENPISGIFKERAEEPKQYNTRLRMRKKRIESQANVNEERNNRGGGRRTRVTNFDIKSMNHINWESEEEYSPKRIKSKNLNRTKRNFINKKEEYSDEEFEIGPIRRQKRNRLDQSIDSFIASESSIENNISNRKRTAKNKKSSGSKNKNFIKQLEKVKLLFRRPRNFN